MNKRLPIRYEITTYLEPGSDVQVRSINEGELSVAQIDSLLKAGRTDLSEPS